MSAPRQRARRVDPATLTPDERDALLRIALDILDKGGEGCGVFVLEGDPPGTFWWMGLRGEQPGGDLANVEPVGHA